MDKIFERFPEVTKDLMNQCNQVFTRYVFYKTLDSGDKECWCTSCGKHYVFPANKRTWTTKDTAFLYGRHNKFGICPKCGRRIMFKSIGAAKQRKNLWEQRKVVFLLPKGKNKVFARAYYAYKDYTDSLTPEIRLSETSKYLWTPGNARMWKLTWGYYSHSEWTERKTLGEPFSKQYSWWGAFDNTYHVLNLPVTMEKTFLKYSQLDAYKQYYTQFGPRPYDSVIEIPVIKYLTLYALAPSIEMMMKLGFEDFVHEWVSERKPNKRLVNWNAKNPVDAFRMSKQEVNAFRAASGSVYLLKLYKKLKGKISFEELDNYIDDFGYETHTFIDLARKGSITPARAYHYLEKQTKEKEVSRHVLMSWDDYLKAAEKLKFDLADEVVYMPKNLKKAHDEAWDIVNAMRREIEERERRERAAKSEAENQSRQKERQRKYAYENDRYFIKVPETLQEIIDEGQALKHCVSSYTSRHAAGKTTILFLRKKDNPDTPFFTIEIWDREVRQIQGFRNRTPLPADVNVFFEAWKEFVQTGSKRPKKKKEATTAA